MVKSFHHYAIIQAYFDEINHDPHARFAELTGMGRDEAKREFYRWAYSHDTVSRLLRNQDD